MAKYSYITDKTHNNRKIQVESAKRDGSGKNIENNYAKQNGNYQSLTAGLSNNFDTKKVMVDESAYNFRQTATMGSMELEVGSPCKVKKIIGGTIVFNQLVTPLTDQSWYQGSMNKSVNDGVATLTATTQYGSTQQNIDLISGHKYILRFDIRLTTPNANIIVGLGDNGYVALEGVSFRGSTISNTEWNSVTILGNYTTLGSTKKIVILDGREDNWDNIYIKNINAIDLTQMFGSTIADYIYSLEQANAGSGVAWFKRYFPKEYYAYNSGELVSVKTQGKKITHFNQLNQNDFLNVADFSQEGEYIKARGSVWDAKNWLDIMQLEEGMSYELFADLVCGSGVTNCRIKVQYDDGTTQNGNLVQGGSSGRSSVITYADKIISLISITYGSGGDAYINAKNMCAHFVYDGERDGEYEPYNSETYPVDDIDLRGIPQLDENNNLAFDGDEYANDGNVTRKYGIVDLGTLEWAYDTINKRFYSPSLTDARFPDSAYVKANIICEKYLTDTYASVNGNAQDMCIGGWYYEGTNYLDIADNSYNGVVEDFVSSLNGVYLVYELTTPTDENSIPFTEVQECDNWGTEEWLAPTTDTRPCEVPVGHETDYLPDLKAKLEVAPNTPNENGVYVMEHNASGNSYTPIATWLANNGYKTEETMKDTFGMKDALGGTLRHLLASKKNIDFLNTAYIDLSSVTFAYYPDNACFYSTSILPNVSQSTTYDRCLCTMYKSVNVSSVSGLNNMEVSIDAEGCLQVKNTDYTDATTFKNAMKGILLAYEKAS